MKSLRRALRRRLPLLVFLAIVAWIITITVWITVNPAPGGGSPA